MPGICTSVTRHDVSSIRDERRNSSAESNTHAVKPIEFTRASIPARTDASSSMMDTIPLLDNPKLPTYARHGKAIGAAHPKNGCTLAQEKIKSYKSMRRKALLRSQL